MSSLSCRVDSLERLLKKDNIVISGLRIEEGCSPFDTAVAFVRDTFDMSNCISEVRLIGGSPPKLLVRMVDGAAKQFLLKNRSKLAGSEIFINHDKTEAECQMEYHIRLAVRKLRVAGRVVRVAGRRVTVDGVVRFWNSAERRLIPANKTEMSLLTDQVLISLVLKIW